MTLQQLTYLVAIYEEGTISGAARELNVSQPTVTQSLRDLERDLKVKLLDRSAGPGELKFTPKGREIVNRAAWIVEAAEDLRRVAREKRPATRQVQSETVTNKKMGEVRMQLGDMEITATELIASMQQKLKGVRKALSDLQTKPQTKKPKK